MAESLPPPGWYPDPECRGRSRYWDGFRWVAPPPRRSVGDAKALLIIGAILGVFFLGAGCVSVVSTIFNNDRKSPAHHGSKAAAPSALPPSATPPVGPTMDPQPNKFYKIDDCFLCTEKPGTWETDGGRGSDPCVWIVRADLTDSIDGLVGGGNSGPKEPARVALHRGDYFTSLNCYPWHRIG